MSSLALQASLSQHPALGMAPGRFIPPLPSVQGWEQDPCSVPPTP